MFLHKMWNRILLIAVLVIIVAGCKKEEPAVTFLPEEEINPDNEQNIPGWFFSDMLYSNRYIYLKLPQNYDTASNKSYPTIYLLDANWYFDGTHYRIEDGGIIQVVNELVKANLMPDAILVGIGNENTHGTSMRGVDFHSYRTPQFIRFIKEELIPEVNARFNIGFNSKENRVLIGHSSGGYFSTHALFQDNLDTMNSIPNYISLSIYGHDEHVKIGEEEQAYYQDSDSGKSLDLKMFMGVGSDEEEGFLITYNHLRDSIMSRNYIEFKLEGKIYQGEDHSSYIPEAVSDGLTFIFK